MAGTINLEILTPQGKYFADEVEYFNFSNGESYLGILPKHAPLVTTLEICVLTIQIKGNKHFYAVGGGMVNITKEKATILVNSIEKSNDIDIERAKASKERAEKRLNGNEIIDKQRALNSLKKANVRIEVSEKK